MKKLTSVVPRSSEPAALEKAEAAGKEADVLNHAITEQDIGRRKTQAKDPCKRILITGVNSLVGHGLFEQMRNDHLVVNSPQRPDKFTGTLIRRDAETVPVPNASIKVLDGSKKPRTFAKSVLRSDKIIIDLLSGSSIEEAEQIIKILKQPIHESHAKQQVLIVISTAFTWANTKLPDGQDCFTDAHFQSRVPVPRFQQIKQMENLALTAAKFNKNLRVHVVCSGLPYGHGEANDVFYEFFRRAWLSLHPELAALPVIGSGDN